MKKIYYAASLLTLASLSVLTGCKKDTTPFPTNPQSNGNYPDLVYTTPWFPTFSDADGIFISAQVTDEKTVIISPFMNEYEYGMAKVANSTGNFSSLADAGTITLNDSILNKSTALSYLSSLTNYTLNLSNTAVWNIAGSGSVPATTFTNNVSSPTYSYTPDQWDAKWVPIYPRTLHHPSALTYSTIPHNALDSAHDLAAYNSALATYITDSTYNATNQYSIPIKLFTSNADSIFIYMTDDKGFVYKRIPSLLTDTITSFKPNDFAGYSSYDLPTFKLQINAIKYNSTMVGTKKYYFLKMASAIKYYQATK